MKIMFKPEYVTLVDVMGDDLRVTDAARVSFAKVSELDEDGCLQEKDAKLINYLAKHKHWSPFSHVMVTLRIKMPIFVERQWFKSSVGFSRNSASRRYVSDVPEFWITTEWRKAATDKKQGSSDEVMEYPHKNVLDADYEEIIGLSSEMYDFAVNKLGVAPEQARMLLPQSMMTEFIETASLAAYARLVKLRTTADAQKEIRDYAHAVSEIMCELFPISWKALMEN